MGKDDKQRRKTQNASSSRAAELLQSSGSSVPFLPLNTADTAYAFSSDPNGINVEDYGDIDADLRISFRKLTKREANTRERGLKAIADVIDNSSSDNTGIFNGAKYFSPLYKQLVFDSSSSVRAAANNVLQSFILRFQKAVSADVLQMVPYTLISLSDAAAVVSKSSQSLLNECFNNEKRLLVYKKASPESIKICLEILQRKHFAVAKQKFEDLESHSQRCERIVMQCLGALNNLLSYSECAADIVSTLNDVYASVAKMGVNVEAQIIKCVLSLLQAGHVQLIVDTKMSMNILKLLESEHEALSKNSFACYMYMADAVSKGMAKTAFKTSDFVNCLVLRMVTNKGQHFKSLEECLLPLIIIGIKSSDQQMSASWILEVLDAFYEGEIDSAVMAAWCRTFSDVVKFISGHYKCEDATFWERFRMAVLKFLKFYIENIELIVPEEKIEVQNTCSSLINQLTRSLESRFEGNLDSEVVSLCDSLLPQSTDLISELVSIRSAFQNKNALIAQCLTSEKADERLFKSLLSTAYQENEKVDLPRLAERLLVWFKTADSVYLECFRFLRSKGCYQSIQLLESISFENLIDLQILFDADECGHINLVSDTEAVTVLKRYLSFVQNDALCENPWTSGVLKWLKSLPGDSKSLFINDAANSPMLPLRHLVKLILKCYDEINLDYLKIILQNVTERLLTFREFVDIEDRSPFDEILRKYPLNFSVIEKSRSCLTDPENANFERFFEFGRGICGISSLVEQFEVNTTEITNLCDELDKMAGELVFLDGMFLTVFALSTKTTEFSSWDRELPEKSLSICQQSMFYMGMNAKSDNTLLFIGMSAAVLQLWRSHSIMRKINENSEERFFDCWNDLCSKWESLKWKNILSSTLSVLFPTTDVPIILLQFFRSFGSKHNDALVETVNGSAIVQSSKNRILASFGVDFEFDGNVAEYDLFAFLRSLERSSNRLNDQSRSAEDENLALVLLADLKAKVQNDEDEWLFLVNGENGMKDATSCAVLRLMVHLAKIAHEMPKELRDFVLCGLVSAMQNSMKENHHGGLSRLMTVLALRFLTEYDRSLRTALLLVKSIVNPSDEMVERRSRLQENLSEWTDFFGNAVATCVMTWFCWFCIHDDYDPAISYPEYLRIEVSKTVLAIDGELGIFDVINSPTALVSSRVLLPKHDDSLLSTKELLQFIASTLQAPHPEIQLAAVNVLQSNILSVVKDEVNEYEEIMKSLHLKADEPSTSAAVVEEPPEVEPEQWEHKLFNYFTALMHKFCSDVERQTSLDPTLLVFDLMIRVIRILNAQSAGAFCSKLEGSIVDVMFRRIFHYIPLDASCSEIIDYVQTPSSAYFLEGSKRSLSNVVYSCWLYYRALETIPAVVREWFVKVPGNALKEFTRRSMSSLLINNEMKRIGSVRSENFVMRARPTTREIVARCQLEDLSLELVIVLPEDYPLSSTIVQHDQRNVLSHGLTKTLHKNLFAFVNNRNGAIIDGILQWKRNVEKTMEGVESCSICLMTVSTSNYRLPDLRCRTCKKKFHSSCMYKWIQSSAKPSCPLCRADFC